jgi:hypothetical protein
VAQDAFRKVAVQVLLFFVTKPQVQRFLHLKALPLLQCQPEYLLLTILSLLVAVPVVTVRGVEAEAVEVLGQAQALL